jgi:phytoene synthase
MPEMADTTFTLAHDHYRTALEQTEQVIRAHSKTFFFATALLPAAERRAIRALYAFCRASDDLVDREETRPEEFDAWQAEVNQEAARQTNPLLVTWAHVRERYAIDRRYERELLEGIRMDLHFRPFQTWAELEGYCYRVASTVGLLSIPIIGLAPGIRFERAAPAAIGLGIALQLTNILRDVGEDARRGRIYFPVEDLARFGLTLRDVQNQVFDERFVGLMRYEIQRARALYHHSLPGIAMLATRARPAVGAAALLYRRILDEIEAAGYQVYHHRAHTTPLQKLAMLPGILAAVIRLKPAAR